MLSRLVHIAHSIFKDLRIQHNMLIWLNIVDIREEFYVPRISNPLSSIPSKNAKPNKIFLFLFYFVYNIFMMMILCWYFILKDPKWTKELSFYFFNQNFTVGHETWTCINPLCLANHCNSNKIICLTKKIHHIVLILMNHVVCVDYNLVGLLFYFIFGLKCMPLSFHMNMDKDLSKRGMELDNDVLYFFTDVTLQLMRDDDIIP